MKNLLLILALTLLISSCSKKEHEADAWGNFEAVDFILSSQTNGQIIHFPVNEGDRIEEGTLIAIIDTGTYILKLEEIMATKATVRSRLNTIAAQNEVYSQQIKNLKVDLNRIKKMYDDGAATKKQLDDISGKIEVLRKQVDAGNSQKSSVLSELGVLNAKIKQVQDQVERSKIRATGKGTIITKYAEAGEVSAAGKPLVKMANLDRIRLKVYVSGGQLPQVVVGSDCLVRIDNSDKGFIEYTGKIIVVGSKAEFTPKIIQTKKERVSMVYPVTIEVVNDGRIKSGMPGEAIFTIDN